MPGDILSLKIQFHYIDTFKLISSAIKVLWQNPFNQPEYEALDKPPEMEKLTIS